LLAKLAIKGRLHRRTQLVQWGIFGLLGRRAKFFAQVAEYFILEGRFSYVMR